MKFMMSNHKESLLPNQYNDKVAKGVFSMLTWTKTNGAVSGFIWDTWRLLRNMFSIAGWRIIPVSKWLITMVSKSPK